MRILRAIVLIGMLVALPRMTLAKTYQSKAEGIQGRVMAVMVDVLREVNEECAGVYPVGGGGAK